MKVERGKSKLKIPSIREKLSGCRQGGMNKLKIITLIILSFIFFLFYQHLDFLYFFFEGGSPRAQKQQTEIFMLFLSSNFDVLGHKIWFIFCLIYQSQFFFLQVKFSNEDRDELLGKRNWKCCRKRFFYHHLKKHFLILNI